MHIAIFGNPGQSHSSAVISTIETIAAMPACRITIESNFAASLPDLTSRLSNTGISGNLPSGTDLVISFGGDGTFLQAVRWTGCQEVPLLGINTGHLGYLAAMPLPTQPEVLCKMISEHNWNIEPRSMLQVEIDGFHSPAYPNALNEVAILKDRIATTISCSAWLDNRKIATYPGDGLLICTPTGSTAYNLSAGGPIVQPTLDTWVISPVASHALTLRPLVVSSLNEIRVEAASRSGSFQLALDGTATTLPTTASVRIKRADFCTKVVRPSNTDWLDTLSEKLFWGARNS